VAARKRRPLQPVVRLRALIHQRSASQVRDGTGHGASAIRDHEGARCRAADRATSSLDHSVFVLEQHCIILLVFTSA